jgi:hypothetical protein
MFTDKHKRNEILQFNSVLHKIAFRFARIKNSNLIHSIDNILISLFIELQNVRASNTCNLIFILPFHHYLKNYPTQLLQLCLEQFRSIYFHFRCVFVCVILNQIRFSICKFTIENFQKVKF